MTETDGESEQRERLIAFGVAPEHLYVDDTTKPSYRGVDDLKSRCAIIADIRPGSRVVVTSLDRLGGSALDTMAAMGDITAKGAAVHVIGSGKTYEGVGFGGWVQDAMDSDANQKRRRMVNARTALAGRKVKRGPKPKLTGAAKERARELYNDLDKPIRQVAEEVGISPTQLRRLFKERGTPPGRRKKEVLS